MQQTFWVSFQCLVFLVCKWLQKYPSNILDTMLHKNLLIYIYSRIPLIQITWDCTVAKLSDILDYQTVPILTYILPGNFLLLLVYLTVQLIRWVFHLDSSLICWLMVIRILLRVFWRLHSWNTWWSGKQQVRRYNSTDTLGGLFEYVP